MTLTIKDPIEADGTSKPGSPGQSSENTHAQSPRSNPVCLEVPVIVRSLPGANSNVTGATGPTREEGRSVIVFDNGGVLRLANPFPPGQTVILSNQQGRDVVCRVVGGRNLPSVKGYIEVEFIEPVIDFWRIHQTLEVTSVPLPEPLAPPAAAPPQVSQVEQPPAPAMPSRPVVPVKERNVPSAGAPSFEDVAGIVLMSPSSESTAKKIEPAVRTSSLQSKDGSAQSPAETPELNSTNKLASPVSEPAFEKTPAPPTQAAFPAPARKQAFSNDFTGKGAQVSVPSSFASSSAGSSESRGRIPMLLGGAALLFAGFGAGYFFMHRSAAPVATSSAAVASQPSTPPANTNISSDSGIAPASQPAMEPAPQQTAQPISASASSSAGVTGPASSDTQNVRQRANSAEANQPDRTAARRPAIPNLKLKSPTSPSQNLAYLPDGSSIASVDMSSAVAPGVASPGTLGGRAENQPAPPPAAISKPASAKNVLEAKLISSTRPVYPAMAKNSSIQGRVVITAEINEKGTVVAATAVSGPMPLRQAALDAVKRWKYSPAQIDGKPAASQITIGLDFRLN